MDELEKIRTYVAIGDSFTEGLNDPYPGEDDRFRGWADRLAEHLAVHSPGLRYANLAVRGKLVRQIVAAHDGAVGLEEAADGRTVFWVELPADRGRAGEPGTPTAGW